MSDRISVSRHLNTIANMDIHDQEIWVRETISMLSLSLIEGIGYWTLFKLASSGMNFNNILKRPSSYNEFSKYLLDARCKLPTFKTSASDWQAFQREIWSKGNELYRQLKKEKVEVIHFDQENFPESLRNMQDAPRWLFVQGNLSILNESAIAVVGTRTPSEDGIFLAKYVGGCIPYFQVNTVSGLANGIDQIIHKESIRFQIPTIAVLGNGIFLNYPAGSENLRSDICNNGGAVITEYLPNQKYSSENFIRRNRLQAGLSDVVIPIEWKTSSGTAHTVHYANKAKKHLVCLKMPDWSEENHSELKLARELNGKIFTIPGEENLFRDTVNACIYKRDLDKNITNLNNRYSEIPMINNHETYRFNDTKNVIGYQLSLWNDNFE